MRAFGNISRLHPHNLRVSWGTLLLSIGFDTVVHEQGSGCTSSVGAAWLQKSAVARARATQCPPRVWLVECEDCTPIVVESFWLEQQHRMREVTTRLRTTVSAGAIDVHGNSTVTIEGETTFSDNSAASNGGE